MTDVESETETTSEEVSVSQLTDWFGKNSRDLPWREDRSPYEIWVAEIMLQQTQVSTVLDYYEDFLEKFPTVEELAKASQDEVLKAWEGMGFYARARRLHEAARTVVDEYQGNLPSSYEDLQQLSGIGEYTAAAIGAFAFDQGKPVVDSNVQRVIARWLGLDNPIDRSDTQSRIKFFIDDLLERCDEPGVLSESIMELGALVCRPADPECEQCPISTGCEAYERDLSDVIPVTTERGDIPHYEIAVAVIERDGSFLISRRPEDKMLGGLWEFPGGKLEDNETLPEALKREMQEELGIEVSVGEKIKTVPHQYSHLSINLHAYRCSIFNGEPTSREGQTWRWVSDNKLNEYAFPKANKAILSAILNQTKQDGTEP